MVSVLVNNNTKLTIQSCQERGRENGVDGEQTPHSTSQDKNRGEKSPNARTTGYNTSAVLSHCWSRVVIYTHRNDPTGHSALAVTSVQHQRTARDSSINPSGAREQSTRLTWMRFA